MKKFLTVAFFVVSTFFASSIFTTASAAECSAYEQSHPNFLLDGAHLSTGNCTSCASCHRGGLFVGTPKSCVACHNGDPSRVTVGRSIAHIPTGVVECSFCHNTASFTLSHSMNHEAVISNQTCASCHGGAYTTYGAQTKGDGHPFTTADCVTCHNTSTWNISHTSIHNGITTNCVSCHNGQITSGKVSNHPATSDACELCHSINANFKCAAVIFGKPVKYAVMSMYRKG